MFNFTSSTYTGTEALGVVVEVAIINGVSLAIPVTVTIFIPPINESGNVFITSDGTSVHEEPGIKDSRSGYYHDYRFLGAL
jgi:hypothetical protein